MTSNITRWMAVPWQADTASCRSGYITAYDPFIPTFWPSRVPNHVLAEENYEKVLNSALPEDERLLAFSTRATWYRLLEGEYLQQINQMITDFGKLGVVERRQGIEGNRYFPPFMYVESQAEIEPNVYPTRNTLVGKVDKVTRQWERQRAQQHASLEETS